MTYGPKPVQGYAKALETLPNIGKVTIPSRNQGTSTPKKPGLYRRPDPTHSITTFPREPTRDDPYARERLPGRRSGLYVPGCRAAPY